jgi:hypothetical protein
MLYHSVRKCSVHSLRDGDATEWKGQAGPNLPARSFRTWSRGGGLSFRVLIVKALLTYCTYETVGIIPAHPGTRAVSYSFASAHGQ